MRRQSLAGSLGCSGRDEHASPPSTLTGSLNRATSKPARLLLDRFLSLLATLAMPLQLSSLALATPTLLLTVLEALLETRLIEVENRWRGSTDNQDKRYLLAVLLAAITQVCEVIASRIGEGGDGWTWRADDVDVNKVVKGNEKEIVRIVEAMVYIAEALGVAEARGGTLAPPGKPRERHNGQLSPRLDPPPRPTPLSSGTADVFHEPLIYTTSASLCAPLPLGSRPLVHSSSADRPLASTTARDSTIAPLSPSSHQTRHKKSIPSTPPHRVSTSQNHAASLSPPLRSPSSSTSSFLATLSDPSSHLVDKWREKRPVSPLSPRKAGSASAEVLASRSVKEALKRLEAGRRERQADDAVRERRGRQEEGKEEQAERARIEPLEPGLDTDERPITPPARLRPRSPRLSDSRSSSSSSSVLELAKSPLPPCTCSSAPPRLARALSPTKPSPPRAHSRTTTPASARARRTRVTRIPRNAPLESRLEDIAFLSVHSSTDVDRSARVTVSTLSPPSIKPAAAGPPPSSAHTPPGGSRSPDDPAALSPYAVALLAKRDALRAKLAALERREADRRALPG